ncbi:MAG: DegV family protein [Eggerthellaceae bacterium]|nr:DegV family protein [Eggerthellaceae bacterium]
MEKCHLIVDSCCDLPAELFDREDVTLLKFPYIMEGETLDDDLFQSTTPSDFYGKIREGAEPSTAQLSVPQLKAAFETAADAGIPTVYLSFSSGLSGSYDVAMLVRDEVLAAHPGFELYVVDTKLASVAEGILVYEALRQMDNGLTAEELAQWAEEARYFVDCEFMVEDLDALRRGGRIPASVAVAGAALDVKPLLSIDTEGKLQLVGVARGRKKGIRALAECFAKNVDADMQPPFAVLGDADCPKDMHRLKDLISKEDPGTIFIESSIGPVIGSHVGAGMLAVVFWGSDKREKLSVADRIARRVKGDR